MAAVGGQKQSQLAPSSATVSLQALDTGTQPSKCYTLHAALGCGDLWPLWGAKGLKSSKPGIWDPWFWRLDDIFFFNASGSPNLWFLFTQTLCLQPQLPVLFVPGLQRTVYVQPSAVSQLAALLPLQCDLKLLPCGLLSSHACAVLLPLPFSAAASSVLPAQLAHWK